MKNCILTFKSNATCTWNPGVFHVTTVEELPRLENFNAKFSQH